MPLTDREIRNAKPSAKPFKLTDSKGLYLEIKPNGKKYWRYRYRIAGKENLFTIGEYSSKTGPGYYSLAEARAERTKARELVAQGKHPLHYRNAKKNAQIEANQNTFKAISLLWWAETKEKKDWTDDYARQIQTVFEGDVYPVIGSMPIQLIKPDHIDDILTAIEKRKANTLAILARQWCSAVFRYAIRKRKAEQDPTAAFKGEIKRKPVQHSKPLSVEEIPDFLEKLNSYGGVPGTVIILKLLMLTFVRTKELREATWDEFNLDEAIWRIPASRMKMRSEHVVPLSTQAVELLRLLHSINGHRQWLFPNSRNPSKCMSATTPNRVLEYIGYKGRFSCHGFRATASTLLNEKGYRGDIIEKALAHSERSGVRRAYNHAEYLQERRAMLQDWADFIDGLKEGGAKVIPILRGGTLG